MEHEMRAEYEEGVTSDAGAPVKVWHMVRREGIKALCGRMLEPSAVTQSADTWGTPEGEPFCFLCGAIYLREVP
ncbi:hypothetical protein [Streptomyces pinistramenti]|uniref:hypothetical protein n=1 Tax=Streptomyces pinistramenti TaxID=2884812 RepID=UPI001D070A10|nr:hypothetical protein [Streptomyces pinistramenti]MCB5908735.1 hypothetical protein [Streptomyces pinistramenti]